MKLEAPSFVARTFLSIAAGATVVFGCGGPTGMSAELLDSYEQPATTDDTAGGDPDAGSGDVPDDPSEVEDASSPVDDDASEPGPPDVVDAGTTDGGDDASGPVLPISCDAPAACTAAEDLGKMDGDQGAATAQATGTTSKWFKIFLVEKNSLPGISTKIKAQLTSPPGVNFDLFLYAPKSGSKTDVECAAVKDSSEETTEVDTVSAEFSDSLGTDESRFVTLEVRHVSGACSDQASWSLAIAGNTL